MQLADARNSNDTDFLNVNSINVGLFDVRVNGGEHLLSNLVMNKKLKKGIQKPKLSMEDLSQHIGDPSLRRRCKRTVFRSQYERNAIEVRGWWNDLFKTLENDAKIPPEQQLMVLRDMFGITMLIKILKICETRQKLSREPQVTVDDDLLDLRQTVRPRYSLANSSKEVEFSGKTPEDTEDFSQIHRDLDDKVQRGTFEKPFSKQDIPKSRMYTDFFKRKPSRAAIWRTLPPLSLEEMNLNQKADAITEQIATDFIDWLRNLGGDEELSLSVQAIIEMFEIGFHANSAKSLKISVKEMPSVPKRVALSLNLPNRAKRTYLHREIQRDVRASKKKTTYTAFGRHLPDDMQVRPPAENYYRKWMSCDRVPEKLASMAAVWQGITHLKSTRAYCKFLMERPEVEPPQYLVECGMMNERRLQDMENDKDNIFANY